MAEKWTKDQSRRPFINGKLIGIGWSTRLTIILIGTCILFSTFFALEFIIAKLSAIDFDYRDDSMISDQAIGSPIVAAEMSCPARTGQEELGKYVGLTGSQIDFQRNLSSSKTAANETNIEKSIAKQDSQTIVM